MRNPNPGPFAAIRKLMAGYCSKGEFPACSAAFVQGGEIVLEHAEGKVGDSDATADTVFMVASISKPFLAVLALQCQRRGELKSLDASINDYIPLPVIHPSHRNVPITIRHLLTHKSGLNDDESALLKGCRWRSEGRDSPIALDRYVKWRLSHEHKHDNDVKWSKEPPGSAKYHYSNAGMTLLGHVLECATKTELHDLARERIFKPIGMVNTFYHLSEAEKVDKDGKSDDKTKVAGKGGTARPKSINFNENRATTSKNSPPPLSQGRMLAVPTTKSSVGKAVRGESNHPIVVCSREVMMRTTKGHYGVAEFPAAGLRSTASDLAKFILAMAAETGREKLGLTTADIDEMMPDGFTNGLAWWGKDAWYGDKRGGVWSHGGFMPGVRSHIYIWPRGKGITTSGQKNGGDKNVGGQKDSSSASNEPTMMGAIFLSNGQGSYLELAELFEEIVRNS